jgi:hypothetical protein
MRWTLLSSPFNAQLLCRARYADRAMVFKTLRHDELNMSGCLLRIGRSWKAGWPAAAPDRDLELGVESLRPEASRRLARNLLEGAPRHLRSVAGLLPKRHLSAFLQSLQ